MVVGLAGLLDLGYAAFFAIGAYAYAYGASPFTGLDVPFWPMLLVGALVAAMFGVLLGAPTLRLRGDYLAIVTLGFGEIVPVVFLNADTYTNGTNGISAVYQPSMYGLFGIGSFGFGNPWPYYVTVLAIVAVAMILLYRLQDSRLGRAWMAIREDELAAASMGINTVTTKLLAFAIGASTAGLAGVFYASKLSLVSPDQFGFTVSFTVLAMVVLGGMGNIWGVAVGAFVIYEIQSQGLKQLNQFFSPAPARSPSSSQHRLDDQLPQLPVPALRPRPGGDDAAATGGPVPNRRRKRELHDGVAGGRREAPRSSRGMTAQL